MSVCACACVSESASTRFCVWTHARLDETKFPGVTTFPVIFLVL